MAQPPRVVAGREGTKISSVLMDAVCCLATAAARGVTGATTGSGALDGAAASGGGSDWACRPSDAGRTDLGGVGLDDASAMVSLIKSRIRASRLPAERPPSTTATIWR